MTDTQTQTEARAEMVATLKSGLQALIDTLCASTPGEWVLENQGFYICRTHDNARGNVGAGGLHAAWVMTEAEARAKAPTIVNGNGKHPIPVQRNAAAVSEIKGICDMLAKYDI
jgi:hypothetical protein